MISSLRWYSFLASSRRAWKRHSPRSSSSCIMPSRYAPEPQAGSQTVTRRSAFSTASSITDVLWLMLVDEPRQCSLLLTGRLRLQVTLQCLATHEADNRFRRVVAPMSCRPVTSSSKIFPSISGSTAISTSSGVLSVMVKLNLSNRPPSCNMLGRSNICLNGASAILILSFFVLGSRLKESAVEVFHFADCRLNRAAFPLQQDSSALIIQSLKSSRRRSA